MRFKLKYNNIEYLVKEYKKGSLFVWERWLDKLPMDYMDCILFLLTQGLKEKIEDINDGGRPLIMDEPLSTQFIQTMEKEQVRVLVCSDDKTRIWPCILIRNIHEKEEPTRIFVGGENLRKYCDERNIYYGSKLTEKNKLLSATQMNFFKEPGEDCRKPM